MSIPYIFNSAQVRHIFGIVCNVQFLLSIDLFTGQHPKRLQNLINHRSPIKRSILKPFYVCKNSTQIKYELKLENTKVQEVLMLLWELHDAMKILVSFLL